MKVLRGEAAQRYAYTVAAAAIAGKPRPETEYKHIDLEDFRLGLGRFHQALTERLRRLPARVSDDPADQAIVWKYVSEILAEAEIEVGDSMFDVSEKDR